MTREEAIANLNMISVAFVEPVTKEQRALINDTFDMAISALSAEGEKKCSKCIHSAEQDGEFCYECIKGNEDNFVSAEGEYIKKEDTIKCFKKWQPYMATRMYEYEKELNGLQSYSFPDREKGEWIFEETLARHYYCSECKSMGASYWDYCPYCGADMRGE